MDFKRFILMFLLCSLSCASLGYSSMIVLIGTQSSGKSSLASALQKEMPIYQLISKDRVERKKKKELQAKHRGKPKKSYKSEWNSEIRNEKIKLRQALDDLHQQRENVIFDCSLNYYSHFGCPKGNDVAIVLLYAPLDVIKQREQVRVQNSKRSEEKKCSRREAILRNLQCYFASGRDENGKYIDVITREDLLNFYLPRENSNFEMESVVNQLGLDKHAAVKIYPNIPCDFSIDTGDHSVEECVQIIKERLFHIENEKGLRN